MRYSLERRASVYAVALATAALAVGCGVGPGTTGTTTGPTGGGTGGESTTGPETPVASCTVSNDTALGENEASAPTIAFGGGHFAVAWSDTTRGAGDIMLTVADADGHAVHEQAIATGAAAADAPAVAALPGGGFVVAWEEHAGAGATVRAQRVGADGTPVGSAMTLSTSGAHESHPDVAGTANGALISWTEPSGAVVAELRNDAIAGKMPLSGASQVAISGGRNLGAAWLAGPQIGFARLPTPLAGSGAAANPITLRAAPGRANVPRLAAGPDGTFAVVWEDARTENEAIYLASIGTDGRPSAETQVSPPGGSADTPDVAFIGDRAAVVYYQFRDGPPVVYLSLIEPGHGRVGDELRISGHGGARFPRIAYAGEGNLGVAYARRGGPVHLATITCK